MNQSIANLRTIAKIEFHGSGVNIPEMLKESIDPASVPAALGGSFNDSNESIEFEVQPGGALWYDKNSTRKGYSSENTAKSSANENLADSSSEPSRSCENLTLLEKETIDLNFQNEEFRDTLAAETRRQSIAIAVSSPSAVSTWTVENKHDSCEEKEKDVTIVGILVLTAQCSSTLAKAAMRDASLLTLLTAVMVFWLFWHSVVFWLALATLGTGFILNMFWGSDCS